MPIYTNSKFDWHVVEFTAEHPNQTIVCKSNETNKKT